MQIEEFYDLFNEKFKAIVLPIYFKILRMGFVEEIYDYKDVKREVQDTLNILEEKYLRDHPFLVGRSKPFDLWLVFIHGVFVFEYDWIWHDKQTSDF